MATSETSRTRRILEASKKPGSVAGVLVLALLLAGAAYLLLPEHWPLARQLLTLLLVAVAAGIAAGVLRRLHRLMHRELPGIWRHAVGGLGAVLAAAGYCALGALLATLWQQERLDALLPAATFTLVFVIAAFRSGYHQT